jgi:hypothetical protein
MFGISAFSQSPFSSLADTGINTTVSSPTNLPWGNNTWGQDNFGGLKTITLNLENVSIKIDVIVTIVGQELVHAIESFVGVSAGGSVSVPVFEDILDTALNNVNIIGTGFVDLTGEDLTLSLNSVTALPSIEAPVTGQNLTTTLNSVFIEIPITVDITGENITSSLNSVTALAVTIADLTGQNLTSAIGEENITGSATLSLNSQNLTTALGEVDPSPDVAVVAPETAVLVLNSVTIITDVNISLIGQNLTLTLGEENALTSITVNAIGQNLIGIIGQLYVTAWAPVDTGQSINYTGVDTGQSINYTGVDTGQSINWTDVAA